MKENIRTELLGVLRRMVPKGIRASVHYSGGAMRISFHCDGSIARKGFVCDLEPGHQSK